jgi:hypothetical protein
MSLEQFVVSIVSGHWTPSVRAAIRASMRPTSNATIANENRFHYRPILNYGPGSPKQGKLS